MILKEKKELQKIIRQVIKAGKKKDLLKNPEPITKPKPGDESDDATTVDTISVVGGDAGGVPGPPGPAPHQSTALPKPNLPIVFSKPNSHSEPRGNLLDGYDGDEEPPVAGAPHLGRPPDQDEAPQPRRRGFMHRLRQKLKRTTTS